MPHAAITTRPRRSDLETSPAVWNPEGGLTTLPDRLSGVEPSSDSAPHRSNQAPAWGLLWAASLALPLALAGCARAMIAGTQVPDTDENRSVVTVLHKMRTAMEHRDAEALIALVSPTYFEDMGTANPEDDYGYLELKTHVLPESFTVAKEFYVSFEIHDVVVEGDRAHADLRYTSRARLELPSETKWDSHKEFNRITLARENGTWMIVGGL